MTLAVREMTLAETPLIVDYFYGMTPEQCEVMGVDPTRLPGRADWLSRYQDDDARPIERRRTMLVIWLSDDRPVGFSTADKIAFGEQATMHLHVIDPAERATGIGARCVALSADLYFERLRLKRLFSEPNAFNVAPNRTLQRAGFRYVKTHRTVPGLLNYHQPVTRWVMER